MIRIPVTVELASEFRYMNPILDEHTLVVVITQSGETADSLLHFVLQMNVEQNDLYR